MTNLTVTVESAQNRGSKFICLYSKAFCERAISPIQILLTDQGSRLGSQSARTFISLQPQKAQTANQKPTALVYDWLPRIKLASRWPRRPRILATQLGQQRAVQEKRRKLFHHDMMPLCSRVSYWSENQLSKYNFGLNIQCQCNSRWMAVS